MTGSYFRGDAEAVLHPEDEARFETITYTYDEQLSGYEHLKQLDIGYSFYSGSDSDEILNAGLFQRLKAGMGENRQESFRHYGLRVMQQDRVCGEVV